ncbi:MAG: VPLPA-CTERM sorting domain-containing protein [Planctomycetota bacterium]
MRLFSRAQGRSRFAAACLSVGVWAGPASAVIIQDFGGSLPDDLPTEALGMWGNNAGAVAIGGGWVLTTRHQDNGVVDRQVTIAGQTYDALASNQIAFRENLDLRLVKLTDTETGATANLTSTVDLFRGTPNAKTTVITGYGPTIGELSSSGDGYDVSGPFNNSNGLSIGRNRIDRTRVLPGAFSGMSLLQADFDEAPGNGSLAFEASLAAGDSGGAWLIQQGEEWQLAGLTHAVEQSDTAQAQAFFGQEIYAVNLSVLADEIDRALAQDYIEGDYNGDDIVGQADLNLVLANFGSTINPVGWVALDQKNGAISQEELNGVLVNWGSTFPPDLSAATFSATTAVPEPASVLLVLAGSAGLLGVRRRAR